MRDPKIKIFADSTDEAGMLEMASSPIFVGPTTMPALKEEVNYSGMCRTVCHLLMSAVRFCNAP